MGAPEGMRQQADDQDISAWVRDETEKALALLAECNQKYAEKHRQIHMEYRRSMKIRWKAFESIAAGSGGYLIGSGAGHQWLQLDHLAMIGIGIVCWIMSVLAHFWGRKL